MGLSVLSAKTDQNVQGVHAHTGHKMPHPAGVSLNLLPLQGHSTSLLGLLQIMPR